MDRKNVSLLPHPSPSVQEMVRHCCPSNVLTFVNHVLHSLAFGGYKMSFLYHKQCSQGKMSCKLTVQISR